MSLIIMGYEPNYGEFGECMRLKCFRLQFKKVCFPLQCLSHSLREASITSLCDGEGAALAGGGRVRESWVMGVI